MCLFLFFPRFFFGVHSRKSARGYRRWAYLCVRLASERHFFSLFLSPSRDQTSVVWGFGGKYYVREANRCKIARFFFFSRRIVFWLTHLST